MEWRPVTGREAHLDHLAGLDVMVGESLQPQTRKALEKYVDLLATVGVERGLLGPREADRIWSRHIVNSAALAPLIPRDAKCIDLGSGAGLPGVVLSLLRPDLTWILIEPLLRRAAFLTEVVAALSLEPFATVLRQRAEDYSGPLCDIVVARAVAPLDRLGGWALPLLRSGGSLLALKGRRAQEEVTLHRSALQRAGAVVIDIRTVGGDAADAAATVVEVRKA